MKCLSIAILLFIVLAIIYFAMTAMIKAGAEESRHGCLITTRTENCNLK